jgi:hypothetical protein
MSIFLPGIIILQIFLSKRENKWLGLILPMISVLFSIMTLITLTVMWDVSVVERIGQSIMLLVVSNIPTIILMAIYLACREKSKKKKEMDKMNIQDLQ